MRTATAAQLTAVAGLDRKNLLRVKVADVYDVMQDLSDVDGVDFLEAVTIDGDVDQRIGTATLHLLREVAVPDRESPVSIAPLMDASPANDPGPLISPNRRMTVEAAVLEIGDTPQESDYLLLFDGYTDDVGWGGTESTVTVPCRDLGAKLFDRWIETPTVYGDNDTPVPIETVMQNILDDVFGVNEIVLQVVGDPDFGIVEYTQQRMSVLDALSQLVDLIGWDFRYLWLDSPGEFALTFYEPDRAAVTPVHTFGPDDYYDVTELNLSSAGVRNVVTVLFRTAAGDPDVLTATDADSIGEFGRRFILLDLLDDGSLQGTAAATALANAVLSDLADPEAVQVTSNRFFPFVEIADLYRWEANAKHYDADQDWGVTSYQHILRPDDHTTALAVRGAPSGGFRRWFRRAERPRDTFLRPASPPTARIEFTASDAEFLLDFVGEAGNGGEALTLENRWRVGVDQSGGGTVWGGWTTWSATFSTGVSVTRLPGFDKQAELEVRYRQRSDDTPGRVTVFLPAARSGIKRDDGLVDPAEPWSGTPTRTPSGVLVRLRDGGNAAAAFGYYDGASTKPVAHEVGPDAGRDGAAQSFSATFQNPPEVFFGQGGANIADPAGSISGQYAKRVRTKNKTASGFDMEAIFEELVGTTTARTASFSSGFSPGPPWQANNANAEAWDDEYLYKYSVTIAADDDATVEFWGNDGSGWELVDTRTYINEDPDDPVTHATESLVIVKDGLFIDVSTEEFGMDVSSTGGGATITPDEVTFETATAPAQETMTPASTPDIPWIAVGK